MTRLSKKKQELKVLKCLIKNVKKYHYYDFEPSEQPDFIDTNRKVGVEVTDFHNSEIPRLVEEKINHSLNIAKTIVSNLKIKYIKVYIHFNSNFLKQVESGKNEYFSDDFPKDLAHVIINLIRDKSFKVDSKKLRCLNKKLSKIIDQLSIDHSPILGESLWQMIRASDAVIDEKCLKKLILNKEKLLDNYRIKHPDFTKFILLINTGSPPIIGLQNKERLYSTTGSIRRIEHINAIQSLFDEVYLVDHYLDRVISNC